MMFFKKEELCSKKLGKEFTGFECMASGQRVVYCSDVEEFATDFS